MCAVSLPGAVAAGSCGRAQTWSQKRPHWGLAVALLADNRGHNRGHNHDTARFHRKIGAGGVT